MLKSLFVILVLITGYNYYARNYVDIVEYIAEKKGRTWSTKVHAASKSGKVIFLRDEKYYPVKAREIFRINDEVFTGEDGYVVIKFGYGSQIKLIENSQIKITDIIISEQQLKKGPREFKFELILGTIYNTINAAKNKFTITGPKNDIKVKGTDFVVSLKKDKQLNVAVLNGKVEVTNPSTGKSSFVDRGQGLSASSDGRVSKAGFHPWVKKYDWQKIASNTDTMLLNDKIKRININRSYTISGIREKITEIVSPGSSPQKPKRPASINKRPPKRIGITPPPERKPKRPPKRIGNTPAPIKRPASTTKRPTKRFNVSKRRPPFKAKRLENKNRAMGNLKRNKNNKKTVHQRVKGDRKKFIGKQKHLKTNKNKMGRSTRVSSQKKSQHKPSTNSDSNKNPRTRPLPAPRSVRDVSTMGSSESRNTTKSGFDRRRRRRFDSDSDRSKKKRKYQYQSNDGRTGNLKYNDSRGPSGKMNNPVRRDQRNMMPAPGGPPRPNNPSNVNQPGPQNRPPRHQNKPPLN